MCLWNAGTEGLLRTAKGPRVWLAAWPSLQGSKAKGFYAPMSSVRIRSSTGLIASQQQELNVWDYSALLGTPSEMPLQRPLVDSGTPIRALIRSGRAHCHTTRLTHAPACLTRQVGIGASWCESPWANVPFFTYSTAAPQARGRATRLPLVQSHTPFGLPVCRVSRPPSGGFLLHSDQNLSFVASSRFTICVTSWQV